MYLGMRFFRFLNLEKMMTDEIKLLDVVVLTADVPRHTLPRGEIGAVIACSADGTYNVEVVAQNS